MKDFSRRDLLRAVGAVGVGTAAAGVLAGCGSSSGSSTSTASGATASRAASSSVGSAAGSAAGSSAANAAGAKPAGGKPGGGKPAGGKPGGGAPGGGGSSSAVSGTAALTVSATTQRKSGGRISAGSKDESGVMVKNGGALTLTNAKITTTGASSSSDDSSFYGLNAGVLVFTSGTLAQRGGSVTTSGDGANGVFAYGSKAKIDITSTAVVATGRYAHGIMCSGGSTMTARNLSVTTSGASSAPVATDRGGGTITVSGGTYKSCGYRSPGIYSTGTITASGASFTAAGAEAVVIEGANNATLSDCALSGASGSGVMIYQSFSGDASGSTGRFTARSGSLIAGAGPLFYVTNATGVITLTRVRTTARSGVLLKAAADQWGTSGRNGGHASLLAIRQTLAGVVVVDKISTAKLRLTSASSFTGTIDGANTARKTTLVLDSTSRWHVSGTSHVTALSGAVVSGSTITNIVGHGHTVYYGTSASSALGGKTYALAGGGTLRPE